VNQLERQNRIVEYLRIKPLSHGQVYTFQIAIPESQVVEIPSQRHEALKSSLTEQGSNLIPLIVRRTEAYSEEEEYEVVYGADWCFVAKELDVEKLWVWVFDMSDEQAAAAKVEMEQLVGFLPNEESEIDTLLNQKLKPITAKLNQLISITLGNTEKANPDEKLEVIKSRLENIESTIEKLAARFEQLLPPTKLNLLEAEEEEINSALEECGANANQIKAALAAIKYWKTSSESLTWHKLEKSTKAGEHKIKNFAKGTYQKLKKVADIRS
jgi:ParB-like chromosome segregation protein Spo0J